MNPTLDKFGKFFIQNLRDRMLDDLEKILSGRHAHAGQNVQKELSGYSEAQKQVLREVAERIITAGMHDLLFALQEESDANGSFKFLVDGQEVAKLSDGLHGELFGDTGWIVRFSKYGSEIEIEASKQAREFIAKHFGKKDDPAG